MKVTNAIQSSGLSSPKPSGGRKKYRVRRRAEAGGEQRRTEPEQAGDDDDVEQEEGCGNGGVVDRGELQGAHDAHDRRARHEPFPAAHNPIMDRAAGARHTWFPYIAVWL